MRCPRSAASFPAETDPETRTCGLWAANKNELTIFKFDSMNLHSTETAFGSPWSHTRTWCPRPWSHSRAACRAASVPFRCASAPPPPARCTPFPDSFSHRTGSSPSSTQTAQCWPAARASAESVSARSSAGKLAAAVRPDGTADTSVWTLQRNRRFFRLEIGFVRAVFKAAAGEHEIRKCYLTLGGKMIEPMSGKMPAGGVTESKQQQQTTQLCSVCNQFCFRKNQASDNFILRIHSIKSIILLRILSKIKHYIIYFSENSRIQ